MEVEQDDAGASQVTCVACGYDLRSQSGDGACPECGTPVHQSLPGLTGITRRELSILALRLMAIHIGIWGMVSVLDGLAAIPLVWGAIPLVQLAGMLLPAAIRAAVFAAVWVLAPGLSRVMVRRDGSVFGTAAVTYHAVASLGAMLMGLYYLAEALSAMVPAIVQGGPFWGGNIVPVGLTASILKLLIALVLLAGHNAIGRAIAWVRTAGTVE